jgi:hypothetical protein
MQDGGVEFMNARNVVFLAVLAVVVIVPDTVRAQRRGGRNELTETLQGEVTVKGVRPGVMQVTTAEGQDWLVTIPTQIENVIFRGSATPQFLQPQMAVRFHTTFPKTDKRKKEYVTSQPVDSLELITLRPGGEPNVYPDEQEVGRRELFQGDEKEQPEANSDTPKKAGDDAEETLACLVLGTVVEYKSGKIKVAAGPYTVVAELPETATISVDVRHCLWAQPGDKVELSARYNPYLRGQAQGQQMTITAAKPLTPPEKASKSRRRGARDRKNDGEQAKDG